MNDEKGKRVDKRELHAERLSTTDEQGKRVYVYPEDVKGVFRKYRTIVYYFLILIYLITPWINIKGHQSILLDIVNRKFIFFGTIFWGHDAPILFFLFAIIAFSIAFITSVWGRVWCGWACPQTVFIDAVFLKIDRLIEGKAHARKMLDAQKWNAEKIFKKSLKWFLYLVVASILTHTFLGYFLGARNLLQIVTHSPLENWGSFLFILISTFLVVFDLGWFREQFCVIACPYGRLQGILMDENSLVVSYDTKRGEPRKEGGDCINCYQCVQVCPTYIDIRRGPQLECISCTQCIDACDNIMTKLKRPKGLIRYDTENGLNGIKRTKLSPRKIIYLTILIAIFITFIITLNTRSENFQVLFLRGNEKAPYQERDNLIINHYKMEIYFYGEEKSEMSVKIDDPTIDLIVSQNPVRLDPSKQSQVIPVFVKFPKNKLEAGSFKTKVKFFKANKLVKEQDLNLVGPFY